MLAMKLCFNHGRVGLQVDLHDGHKMMKMIVMVQCLCRACSVGYWCQRAITEDSTSSLSFPVVDEEYTTVCICVFGLLHCWGWVIGRASGL